MAAVESQDFHWASSWIGTSSQFFCSFARNRLLTVARLALTGRECDPSSVEPDSSPAEVMTLKHFGLSLDDSREADDAKDYRRASGPVTSVDTNIFGTCVW
ncbi:hypothetical protein Pst134EB_004060 [Puccinia striiformis f. sp. tritici]|nr:hypothetical protein Pst134EB_004060 [Puccinia striiformis f. sp. tritici]